SRPGRRRRDRARAWRDDGRLRPEGRARFPRRRRARARARQERGRGADLRERNRSGKRAYGRARRGRVPPRAYRRGGRGVPEERRRPQTATVARSDGMTTYNDTRSPFPAAVAGQTSAFLNSVYGWMCFGLVLTAATAWVTASSPTLVRTILGNGPLFWVLAFVQLAIVFVLSARVQQLTSTTAAMLFIAYSALTGLTLSFVLLAFTGESIATTFLVSGGTFAGLAIFGTTTNRR